MPNFYKLTGAGGPKGRRVPTAGRTMPKACPLLASAFNVQVRRVADEVVVEVTMPK